MKNKRHQVVDTVFKNHERFVMYRIKFFVMHINDRAQYN